MTAVKLSEHLTYRKIFKVTIMPILLILFSSIYGIVDGFCVSFFAGEDAFAGVNLIFPIICIVGSVGFIFGAGGSALIGKYLGEGKTQRANECFTNALLTLLILGIFLSVGMFFFIEPIVNALAEVNPSEVSPECIAHATLYGRVLILCQPLFMMQNVFSSFFLLDEKPMTGFKFIFAAGVTNMVLDVVFVGLFKWGVAGAAVATGIGQGVAAVGSFLYFKIRKDNLLQYTKINYSIRDMVKIFTNGISEFAANISNSVVSIVFNIQLMVYYGQMGISAYGSLMYLGFVFISIFFGFGSGIAPFVSFNYGKKDTVEISNIFRRCVLISLALGFVMFVLCEALASPLGHIFCSGNEELAQLATTVIRINATAYVVVGFSIFSSVFFTALNNGVVSAVISLVRCLVLQISFVFILPPLVGPVGIWLSPVFAEAGSVTLSLIMLLVNAKKYGYTFKKAKPVEQPTGI